MNDTQQRFLRMIAERVPVARIVELHLFAPIRQGGAETGVAVFAALTPVIGGDDAEAGPATAGARSAEDAANEHSIEEPGDEAPIEEPGDERRVDEPPPDEPPASRPPVEVPEPEAPPMGDPQPDATPVEPPPSIAPPRADASSSGDAEAVPLTTLLEMEPVPTDLPTNPEVPDVPGARSEQVPDAAEADAAAAGSTAAGSGETPDAAADFEAPPAASAARPPIVRHVVMSARYRLTLKGVDRGKWEMDVVEEADAPLITVDAVVRGVQRRAGDLADVERFTSDTLLQALSETVWATKT